MNNEILDNNYSRPEPELILANKGKRLLNYLIDTLVISAIFLTIIEWYFEEGLEVLMIEDPDPNLSLSLNLLSLTISIFYYLLMEGGTSGKTIGKFVTGTKVLHRSGKEPAMNDILLRSVCRVIPFEAISFLGPQLTGWHDRWSKTIVIDEQLSGLKD